MTPYGRYCTELFVREIVRLGCAVVSGLAFGIDGIAHRAALDQGGQTVAVLGGGIDDRTIYPRAHTSLAQDILKAGGALISEYPPGMGCRKHHFPERNRIVAGLAEAVLVIEAPRRSGSMITARLALESGREVWAVPGPIDHANSEGVNWLISQGATPVTSRDDVAYALGFEPEIKVQKLDGDEARIAECLKERAMFIDEIALKISLSIPETTTLLTRLEMSENVRSLGDGRFTLYT